MPELTRRGYVGLERTTLLLSRALATFLLLGLFYLLTTSHAVSQIRVYGTAISGKASVIEEDTSSVDDGILIDSVEIENRDIYDLTNDRYDNFLFRTANRLHIVTKRSVIRRELLLKTGEPFSAGNAEETARNLRLNCRLVDAWIETETLPNGHLLVRVITIDQWSLIGGVEIARDGNRTRFKLGFEERNLLGYNQLLGVDWVIQQEDDNYSHSRFQNYRFLGQAVMLDLEYNTDPTNELSQVRVLRPYYNLDQQFYWSAAVAGSGGRRDVYGLSDEGATVRTGYWKRKADNFDLISEYRVGSRYTKLTGGLWYSYHADNVTEAVGHGFSVPDDSLYHGTFVIGKLMHTDYLRRRRINNFNLLEDAFIETGVEALVGRAFNSDFKSHQYDVLDISTKLGKQVGNNFFTASHQQSWWLRSGKQLRSRAITSLRYFNNGLSFLTAAARLQYQSDYYNALASPIRLGGTSGLRGYDEFALAGNRAGTLNIETRWFPGLDILSALIGGVVFADVGRVWKEGEPFTLKDLRYSIGAGLRISLERATRSELFRIDCAVLDDGTVQVAFGTGQYF